MVCPLFHIDPTYQEDPLARLEDKMKMKNLHFSLKEITEKKLLKAIKSMKSKKSSGYDEITWAFKNSSGNQMCIFLANSV